MYSVNRTFGDIFEKRGKGSVLIIHTNIDAFITLLFTSAS